MTDTLSQKAAAVTGSTGAIGKAIAEGLAAQGLQVILINRDQNKNQQIVKDISSRVPDAVLHTEICDLSRESSLADLINNWDHPLDILINNAAVTPPHRQETPEGIELQFATNVLGYFWMMLGFSDILALAENPRIINVASYWAGGLDLSDLEFKRRTYHNDAAYRQSKQANRMLTAVFAEKFQARGISVNACHPGDVNSRLSNNLGFGGSQTPEEGAETPVWAATSSKLVNVTGKYFENRQVKNCPFMAQKEQSEMLYEICLDYTNILQ